MVTTKEGKAAYGHRQIFDILNPTYLHYGERVIRRLLEHTAFHPSVIGFQIDNETKHYGNDGEENAASFREHLQEKYKDTDTFNRTFYLSYWSNSIHSWDDLPDMRGCVNGGLVESTRPSRGPWRPASSPGRRTLCGSIKERTSSSPTIWILSGRSSGRTLPRTATPTGCSRI